MSTIVLYLLVFASIALAALSYSVSHDSTILTPIGLYTIVWTVAVISYQLKILPFPNFSSLTRVILPASLLAFCIGCLAADSVLDGRRSRRRGRFPLADQELRLIVSVGGGIGLIGGLASVASVLGSFGLEGFLEPSKVRRVIVLGQNNPIGPILGTGFLAISFATVPFAGILLYRGGKPILGYLPLVAIILTTLAMFGRWQILLAILLYVFAWIQESRSGQRASGLASRRRMAGFVLPAILVIALVTVVTGKLGTHLSEYSESSIWLPFLAVVERLDVPLYGLNTLLATGPEYTFGAEVFAPIHEGILRLVGGDVGAPHPTFARNVSPLNPQFGEVFLPVTYLGFFYHDFGLAGILVAPAILGFLATFLYRSNSPYASLAYVFVISAVVRSFASWTFWFPFYLGALLIGILTILFMKSARVGWRKSYCNKMSG